MLVISNTSPLHYLIAVGQDKLLAQLFGRILIPRGVAQELGDKRCTLSRSAMDCPTSIMAPGLHAPSQPDTELMTSLDLGEREAIQLTAELKADILIIDEWRGRVIARRRGLPLIGALGVLGTSYQRALIDDPLNILALMRQQGFRISERLVADFEILIKTKYARDSPR